MDINIDKLMIGIDPINHAVGCDCGHCDGQQHPSEDFDFGYAAFYAGLSSNPHGETTPEWQRGHDAAAAEFAAEDAQADELIRERYADEMPEANFYGD